MNTHAMIHNASSSMLNLDSQQLIVLSTMSGSISMSWHVWKPENQELDMFVSDDHLDVCKVSNQWYSSVIWTRMCPALILRRELEAI
jgi:hypothetical protein